MAWPLVRGVTIGPLVAVGDLLPSGLPNPAFNPGRAEVRRRMRAMRASPRLLERPVVVLSGYKAWPHMAMELRQRLTALTSGEPGDFASVAYSFRRDIDEAVAIALDRVDRAFPPEDPVWTREVDVVGISMGGLVARRAAMDRDDGGRRMRIRRLFTLASPHRGSCLADRVAPDRAAMAMRSGSAFLRSLDKAWETEPLEIYPYAVLNDKWVSAQRSAPPGEGTHWVRGAAIMSHFTVSVNRAIVADIALRLRGEAPLSGGASEPPSR
ncbi:MAG: hypothetical protein H6810_10215 [Phycisphaeraceae bacterium]|nr:MAG: hypothetical protein H6810_10215 [Phycisphaeraceae bacterium]